MNLKLALSNFNLPVIPSTGEQLKAIYRKLARANHPDRGGDVKKMQQINLAYEYLAQHCTKATLSNSARLHDLKAQREADKAAIKHAGEVMFSFIDLDLISERLQVIFEDTFVVISDVIKSNDVIYEKTVTWRTEDCQKALCLDMYISIRDLDELKQALSTNNEMNLPIHTKFTLFADGRDIKLAKRRWLPTMTKSELFDINILLPIQKVKKAYDTNQKRAMKRIDGLSFLRLCAGFKASASKDTLQIRDKEKGLILQAARLTTFGGYYSGSVHTLENHRSSFAGGIRFFPEDGESFTAEVRALVVNYQNCNTLEEVEAISNQIKEINEKPSEVSNAA